MNRFIICKGWIISKSVALIFINFAELLFVTLMDKGFSIENINVFVYYSNNYDKEMA